MYRKHKTYAAAEANSKRRKEEGTRMHLAMEAIRLGYGIDAAKSYVAENEQSAVEALAETLTRLDLEHIETEGWLESKEHEFHGSFDGIDKVNGIHALPEKDFWGWPIQVELGCLAITDLKTKDNDKGLSDGEMKKHAMQMASYALMVKENRGYFPNLGLILQLDLPTAVCTVNAVYPLDRWVEAALLQRTNWDIINNKGKWAKR
jgi:hypothetical protein